MALSPPSQALLKVRIGTCPDEMCRYRILFRTSARTVKCRRCSGIHLTHQLLAVDEPMSSEAALQWVQDRASSLERASEMGAGRWRAASRAVDGISSHAHAKLMQQWFEHYGVTEDGRVKRLNEMGRSDPINVATLANYAFAIRQEHLELYGYGRDETAYNVYAKTISALNAFNERHIYEMDMLVPLAQTESKSPWSTAAAISKACVGREVFTRILVENMREHLKRHWVVYKQPSTSMDSEWSALKKTNDVSLPKGEAEASEVLDLAILANILGRCILLLDIADVPTVQAFVPFLVNPNRCRDSQGTQRSPLLIAWADRARGYKLAMVAPTTSDGRTITTVRLPRKCIRMVWGRDTPLDKYIDFDDKGRFIVGNGKYFKPEFLQEYVDAFEKEAIRQYGVSPALEVDYLAARGSKARVEHPQQDLMSAAAERRLWRCMRCWEMTISENPQSVSCRICLNDSKHSMRHQHADGAIEYHTGDHTPTPAPNSWCFMKRKHFYFYEYDNAAVSIPVAFPVDGNFEFQDVMWFCDESNTTRNSDILEETQKIVSKLCFNDVDINVMARLISDIELQIQEGVQQTVAVNHRLGHLKKNLGGYPFDRLFDDHSTKTDNAVVAAVKPARMTDDVKNIIASGTALYEEFRRHQKETIGPIAEEGSADSLIRELWEGDGELNTVESGIFSSLEEAMKDHDAEQRWQILRSDTEMFAEGGLFYSYADRHFRHSTHFKLPLLEPLKFAFCDAVPALAVCVEGAGHFPVAENPDINRIAGLLATKVSQPNCTYVQSTM